MQGLELPSSKGVTFLRTDPRGKVAYVRENPEHFVKLGALALPALGLAAPVVRALGPAALPNYWGGCARCWRPGLGWGCSISCAGLPAWPHRLLWSCLQSCSWAARKCGGPDSSSHQASFAPGCLQLYNDNYTM
jgi:hypothetical protein